jgi:hypothetical protein
LVVKNSSEILSRILINILELHELKKLRNIHAIKNKKNKIQMTITKYNEIIEINVDEYLMIISGNELVLL